MPASLLRPAVAVLLVAATALLLWADGALRRRRET